MSENNEGKSQEKNSPHIAKTIGKRTYPVTCHFGETSKNI